MTLFILSVGQIAGHLVKTKIFLARTLRQCVCTDSLFVAQVGTNLQPLCSDFTALEALQRVHTTILRACQSYYFFPSIIDGMPPHEPFLQELTAAFTERTEGDRLPFSLFSDKVLQNVYC